ncbi:MAG: cysteine desulfurase [Hyphomicrobiales bacterium]|mgnify:CR=1 FL=1|nr:MAG: cysteine desulfurase [Hyphomicrobiales bacterium]
MSGNRHYLDWNASAPLRPEARDAMIAALSVAGNPSSVHAEGRAAAMTLATARDKVARLAGAASDRVTFTSGGTEANALAVRPDLYDRIIISAVEHESVLGAARSGAAEVVEIPVDTAGRVDLAALEKLLETGEGRRTLVSVMAANNEIGTLQPVAQVADLARAHGATSHCDAVQALGKVPLTLDALGVDMMSISAHKIGGPKGVGALVLRSGFDIAPRQVGGGQERNRRAGTENLAGIAGFGAAAEAALAGFAEWGRIARLRDRLEEFVIGLGPDGNVAPVVLRPPERLTNTASIALPGMKAETVVMMLDLAGVAVSAGAACSSGKVRASHVLTAMGLPTDITTAGIRVSLGWTSDEADIDAFCTAWRDVDRRWRTARNAKNERQVA